jgi:hypothetical protein
MLIASMLNAGLPHIALRTQVCLSCHSTLLRQHTPARKHWMLPGIPGIPGIGDSTMAVCMYHMGSAPPRLHITTDSSTGRSTDGRMLPPPRRFRDSSPAVAARLAAASADFPRMRRVAGDGDCFYRAMLFAILEHIVSGPSLALHQRVILRLEQLWLQLWQMLTPDEATCAGRDNLMALLRRMWFLETTNAVDLTAMEGLLQERGLFDPIIKFMRMITSFELQVGRACRCC